jgi:Zn-dependent peptidase ImmA (M78 family)
MAKKTSDLLPIVENYAESIIMKEIGSLELPIDITKIIRNYGIEQRLCELPDNEAGAIIISEDFSAMLINQKDNLKRQRFTAAHELGHFISYRYRGETGTRIDRRNLDSSSGKDIEEIFANKFAAAILMPITMVKKALNITEDIIKLAILFNVSAEAMENRIKNI